MLLGAHLAGAAIENSMLGATHACANPLSAHFGMPHGVAIGVMLPHVIRFNGSVAADLYGQVAEDAGLCERRDVRAAELLADHVRQIVEDASSPTKLAECDVDPTLIPKLAAEAANQWTGKFNPRPVDPRSFEELYTCAL
jgi:alcohol dehydrogenase